MYTVWFNMLFGDARDRWDGDGVTDPRVSHFWDEQKLVGNWYSSNVLHREGTIITRHDQLRAAISPLLHPGT